MSLASVRVDVAAFARHGQPPHHLHATLSCIKSWRAITELTTLDLVVHSNDEFAIRRALDQTGVVQSHLPRAWSVRVASWDRNQRGFMLAHAHLSEWAALVSGATRGRCGHASRFGAPRTHQ